jgi:dihydroorotate dehydrogenase (fumarate)
MIDLSSKFLGIPVKTPIIIGSSGLSSSVDSIVKFAANGAGAVVLKSVFEEEILLEYENTVRPNIGPMDNDLEFFDYYDYQIKKEVLDKYVNLISEAKSKTDIPVIASINCRTGAEWVSYARRLQDAGADALELNLFRLPYHDEHNSVQLEQSYIEIVKKVKSHITIPLAVKISPYFTNLKGFVEKLSDAGANGVVLFNRFYSLDFDIEKESVVSGDVFTSNSDVSLPLRWISLMSNKVECELVGSTGVHDATGLIKMLLAGASSVQVVSSIYQHGAPHLQTMLEGLTEWMQRKGYESISEFRGNMSQSTSDNPEVFERVQFMRYFSDHSVL